MAWECGCLGWQGDGSAGVRVAGVPGVWCGCLGLAWVAWGWRGWLGGGAVAWVVRVPGVGAGAWGWRGDERLPDAVCSAGVVRLRQGFGVTASAFYGAAPHKKLRLGSSKGLPSRSFFSEKTEAGAYGLRSPIPPKRSIREFRRFRRLMFHERSPRC